MVRQIGRVGGFGDFEGAMHLVGAVADADGEDGADVGGVGAGEDLREVFGGVHVEVGVTVDEHGKFEVRGEVPGGGASPLPPYFKVLKYL